MCITRKREFNMSNVKKVSTSVIANRMNNKSNEHVKMSSGKAYSKVIASELNKINAIKQYKHKTWGSKHEFLEVGLILNEEGYEFTLKDGATYTMYNIEQTNASEIIANSPVKSKKQPKKIDTYTLDQLKEMHAKELEVFYKTSKRIDFIKEKMKEKSKLA